MKGELTFLIVERPDLHKTFSSPGGKLIGPRVQLERGEEWLGSGSQFVGGMEVVLRGWTWGVAVVHSFGP